MCLVYKFRLWPTTVLGTPNLTKSHAEYRIIVNINRYSILLHIAVSLLLKSSNGKNLFYANVFIVGEFIVYALVCFTGLSTFSCES